MEVIFFKDNFINKNTDFFLGTTNYLCVHNKGIDDR